MYRCPDCEGTVFVERYMGHLTWICLTLKCAWMRPFGTPVRVIEGESVAGPFGVAPRISCADCRG